MQVHRQDSISEVAFESVLILAVADSHSILVLLLAVEPIAVLQQQVLEQLVLASAVSQQELQVAVAELAELAVAVEAELELEAEAFDFLPPRHP